MGDGTKPTAGMRRLPAMGVLDESAWCEDGGFRRPSTHPAAAASDQKKLKLRVMRRQKRAAVGYGRAHSHSIRSMALREFSNEIRLYGACRWEPSTEIMLPDFIASTRA
jgi:hypothetical protein